MEGCAFIENLADKKRLTDKTISRANSGMRMLSASATANAKTKQEGTHAPAECKQEEVVNDHEEERRSVCSRGSSCSTSKTRTVNKL